MNPNYMETVLVGNRTQDLWYSRRALTRQTIIIIIIIILLLHIDLRFSTSKYALIIEFYVFKFMLDYFVLLQYKPTEMRLFSLTEPLK